MFDCPVVSDTGRHYAQIDRDDSLSRAIDSDADLMLDDLLAAETPKQVEKRNAFVDDFLAELVEKGNEKAKDQAYEKIMQMIRQAYDNDRSIGYRDDSLSRVIDSDADLMLDDLCAAETPKQLENRNAFVDDFLAELAEVGNEKAKDQAYEKIMQMIRQAYDNDRSIGYRLREFSERHVKDAAYEQLLDREVI